MEICITHFLQDASIIKFKGVQVKIYGMVKIMEYYISIIISNQAKIKIKMIKNKKIKKIF